MKKNRSKNHIKTCLLIANNIALNKIKDMITDVDDSIRFNNTRRRGNTILIHNS